MTNEVEFLGANDKVLQRIIASIDLPQLPPANPIFHDLMACIIEQQIPYRSTKKTFERLLEKADLTQLSPENFEQFEERALGESKLSENKFATLARILEQWDDMPKDWNQLPDEEVKSALKSIKGIGPWTMDMILLYTLRRPDIFPADDYHLKQIMPSLYGLDRKSRLKAQMKEVAENWSPNRSLAVRYVLEWKKVGGVK